MSLSPGTRLGHYDVTAQISQGGMGEVYRARDTKLDLNVAPRSAPLLAPNAGPAPARRLSSHHRSRPPPAVVSDRTGNLGAWPFGGGSPWGALKRYQIYIVTTLAEHLP